MKESKRLLKNTGIIAIGNLSTKLVSFLLLPLYTALLTTEEYGQVDYVLTLSVFIVPFVSLLMDEAVFRFLVDCKTIEEIRRRLSQAYLVSACGVGGFVIIGGIILCILQYRFSAFLICYVVFSVASALISSFLRGTGKMKQFALYGFLQSALTIVLNVLLIAVFRMGAKGMMLATLASFFVTSSAFFLGYRLYKEITFRNIRREELREILRYSLPLIPNRISWNAVNLLNRVLIVEILGDGMNGLFALGCKFSTAINLLYSFFYQAWMESAARIRNGAETTDVVRYYNTVYRSVKRIMLSLVICLISVLPLAYRILVDESYYDSIWIVPILLISVYFDSLSSFIGGIFAAHKDTRIMGQTTVIAVVISCIMCVAGIRRIGMFAPAIATMFSYFIAFILRRAKTEKYVVFEQDKRWILIAFGVLAAIAVAFYSQNDVLRWLSIPIACTFAFLSNRGMIEFLIHRKTQENNYEEE